MLERREECDTYLTHICRYCVMYRTLWSVYFYSWWKSEWLLKLLYLSPGSVRYTDVYKRVSGRCRTLLFFLMFLTITCVTFKYLVFTWFINKPNCLDSYFKPHEEGNYRSISIMKVGLSPILRNLPFPVVRNLTDSFWIPSISTWFWVVLFHSYDSTWKEVVIIMSFCILCHQCRLKKVVSYSKSAWDDRTWGHQSSCCVYFIVM